MGIHTKKLWCTWTWNDGSGTNYNKPNYYICIHKLKLIKICDHLNLIDTFILFPFYNY